jgi:hypothetical protein
MSLVCYCIRDSINPSREGIFQVALGKNLTEWNVDMNTKNLGPSFERMVRTICFSSLYLSTSQALSCDSKSLNFVNKYWILSKIFGSNVRNSTYNMCPLISSCFPNIPSKVVQGSLRVLQEDMSKRRPGEIRLQILSNASSIRFRYLDFSMDNVGSVFIFKVNL